MIQAGTLLFGESKFSDCYVKLFLGISTSEMFNGA